MFEDQVWQNQGNLVQFFFYWKDIELHGDFCIKSKTYIARIMTDNLLNKLTVL